MIDVVKQDLSKLILTILDDSIERELDRVVVEWHSNLGEVKAYEFNKIDAALEFLNNNELKNVFITSDSLTLFEPKPCFDEDDNT